MKALCIHAHFDDFEFTCAGTFLRWRQKFGEDFVGKIIVCTDGGAGHHELTREQTSRRREQEQEAAAQLLGVDWELLRLPDGTVPREGMLRADGFTVAAIWEAIRAFEPDVIFAPPLPGDPLAGVHTDHLEVAAALRRVGYLINVPHAFLPEYPEAKESPARWLKTPIILATADGYQQENQIDLVVDVAGVFADISAASYCHTSQIAEWLPWIARHDLTVPKNLAEWRTQLERRYFKAAARAGVPAGLLVEMFGVTGWGRVPTAQEVDELFNGLLVPGAWSAGLERKLANWFA